MKRTPQDPVDAICDLLEEHGEVGVLEYISLAAKFQSEEENNCDGCRKRDAAVHEILKGAIAQIEALPHGGDTDPFMDRELG